MGRADWPLTMPCRSSTRGSRADGGADGGVRPTLALEEAHRLGAVAHQHVLGLLIVFQHLLVGFAAEAGFLIASECGSRRVHVIAVGPAAAGFDGAAHAVAIVDVAGPHAGAQAVDRRLSKASWTVVSLARSIAATVDSSFPARLGAHRLFRPYCLAYGDGCQWGFATGCRLQPNTGE